MKKIVTVAALLLNSSIAFALQPTPVPLQDVRITDGPFLHAQTTDLNYLMVMDPDRLLAPYLKEAGLPSKADNYPNWENTGLDGHIGGHYLSALSLMYASTGDTRVLERLNYMVDELEKCQQANGNGYLGGVPNGAKLWDSIAKGDIRADLFTLNDSWVPWYNVHKVFAGLKDAYIYTGNEKAKQMMVLFSDWMQKLSKDLSDQQLQLMLRTEYGGLNETLADAYEITGNKAYLTLAKRYTDLSILNPLLENKDALTGLHANTQIPKVVGVARIAQVENNKAWHDSADFFWQTIVNHRTVSIGGNSVREHFHPSDDFSSMLESVEGPETCNTYNMLKLSKILYENKGELNYIDYYERALYNHILSSQHPDDGGLVYFTAMRPNQYRVYSDPQKSMWCCVGSGIENHAKYGEMIYAEEQDQLFVNLFIDSTLDWQSQKVKLKQTTQFPDANTSEIEVLSQGKFGLNLRYPIWANAGELKVTLNGKTQKVTAKPGEYIKLARSWKAGDKVAFTLPMNVHLEQMPDKSDYYSVLYGPIVLAAKTNPFPEEKINFIADDSRMGHIAKGPTCEPENAPVFISDGTKFLKEIKKRPTSNLSFTTGNAKLNLGQQLELIPFFRLHDSRYSVYFGQSSADNWQNLQARLAEQSRLEAQLAASTLDLVQPGEQQPESDHFFEAFGSEAGLNGTRHWRHATDWFSYLMNAKGEQKPVLRLTFFGLDSGREFDILIDDRKLATVKLTGEQGPVYFTKDYPIPAELIADPKQSFRVKFQAKPNSIAGGLYEVRLMKPNAK